MVIPMRKIILLALLFGLIAGPGWCATKWVDLAGTGTGAADGSDVDNLCAGLADGDCTPASGDIIKLCNTSSTTKTIATAAGGTVTYDMECTGGTNGLFTSTSGSALAFSSAADDVVLLNPNVTTTGSGTWGIYINGASNITINGGGTVTNGGTSSATWTANANGLGVIGPTVSRGISLSQSNDSDNIHITGVEIKNSGEHGIALINAANGLDYDSIEIDNCYIHNNGDAAGEMGVRLSVVASGTATITDAKIHDSIIHTTYDYGIDLNGGSTSTVTRIVDPELYNLTVYNCGATGPANGVGGGGIRLQNVGPSVAETYSTWLHDSWLSENLGNGGGLVLLYSSYGILEDLIASDNVIESNQYDGGGLDIDHDNDHIILRRFKCAGNLGNDEINSGYGLMVLDSTNISISNGILSGNKKGIFYNPNLGGSPTTHDISNLTIFDNVDGVYVHTTADDDIGTFLNCIISSNTTGINVADADSDQIFNYCVVAENTTARTNQDAGANDIALDPLLNSDGSLTARSPAVNAGTTAGTVGLSGTITDAFGNTDTFDSTYHLNIGADQTRHNVPMILAGTLLAGNLLYTAERTPYVEAGGAYYLLSNGDNYLVPE
jgi:hypothetical protein